MERTGILSLNAVAENVKVLRLHAHGWLTLVSGLQLQAVPFSSG